LAQTDRSVDLQDGRPVIRVDKPSVKSDRTVLPQAQPPNVPAPAVIAEVAHDVANLLMPVATNCALLMPGFPEHGLGRRCLEGVERSTEQAILLTRRLLMIGLHRLAQPEDSAGLSSGPQFRNASDVWLGSSLEDLLSLIQNYCHVLLRSIPAGDARLADALEMTKASQRAHALSCLLPGVDHGAAAKIEALDLNALVSDLIGIVRRLLGSQIEVVTELEADLGTIRGDPVQIGRVILNLATNARDAMQGKGRLTIGTKVSECAIGPGKHRRRVVLSIGDTGCGMGDNMLSKAFLRGYTTKEVGKGTGLGLSIVRQIVRQSNGRIHVQSIPGQGTTFEVSWPLRAGPS
jgi:signal transduction histidine kinase